MEQFNQLIYQRVQDVEYRLEKLKIVCQNLQNGVSQDFQNNLTNLETQISEIKQHLQNHDNTLASHSAKFENLENSGINFSTLATELEQIKAKISNLENSDLDLETIANIQSDISALKSAVSDLQNTQAQNSQSISALGEELVITQQLAETNQSNIDTLQNIVNNHSATIPTLQPQITQLKSQVSNLESEHANFTTEINAIKAKNENQDIVINNINGSLASHVNTYNQTVREINETNSSQEKQINSLAEDIVDHSTRLSVLENSTGSNTLIENELSFILNGTYMLQTDIDDIINGTY